MDEYRGVNIHCLAILQSGARKGQLCGVVIERGGGDVCRRHLHAKVKYTLPSIEDQAKAAGMPERTYRHILIHTNEQDCPVCNPLNK